MLHVMIQLFLHCPSGMSWMQNEREPSMPYRMPERNHDRDDDRFLCLGGNRPQARLSSSSSSAILEPNVLNEACESSDARCKTTLPTADEGEDIVEDATEDFLGRDRRDIDRWRSNIVV